MRKYLFVFIVMLFLFFSTSSILHAAKKRTLLVMPFENIGMESTGSRVEGGDLGYMLSVVIADKIQSKKRKNPYSIYVVSKENYIQLFPLTREKLYSIGSFNDIDIILFGFFDAGNGSLQLYSKMFFVDRKMAVEVNESYPIIYKTVKWVEKIGVEGVARYKQKGKVKALSIFGINEEEVKTESTVIREKNYFLQLENLLGMYMVFGGWDEYYPTGVFNEISLFLVPTREKRMVFSVGVRSRYSVFSRREDQCYISSVLTSFYIGPAVEYRIRLFKKLKMFKLSYTAGFSASNLNINNRNYGSFDPSDFFDAAMIFKFGRDVDLSLNAGYYEIMFIDEGLLSVYLSLGFLFD